jgi:hypothetical protein
MVATGSKESVDVIPEGGRGGARRRRPLPDPNQPVANVCVRVSVSLFGFQLRLNQTESWTDNRAGHSRVFIGLDAEQGEPFRRHLTEKLIKTTVIHWGAPTLVIRDADENELFFWLPESERAGLEAELATLNKPVPWLLSGSVEEHRFIDELHEYARRTPSDAEANNFLRYILDR